MRLFRVAPLGRVVLLLGLAGGLLLVGCGHTTDAEQAANQYAAQEMAAAAPHGNLPDYALPPEKLAQAQELASLRVTIHFAGEAWGIVQLLLLLWVGAIGWFRDVAVRTGRNRWVQAYVFLLLFLAAGFVLDLPIDLYAHHLSLRYGLSVQGWASWFGDVGKSFGLEWLVGGLLVMLLFRVIRRFPRRWWLAGWGCAIPVLLFAVFVAPYIEPLYNHYEPLEKTQPALVARLEQVAQRGHMRIPPERMYLMRASAKTTTLNADVEGFGHSKRLVVWDTTIADATPDEILFIFGHESGHYVLGHIVQGVLLSFVAALVLLWLGFHFVRWAIARFGRSWRVPAQEDWAALAVLVLAFSVFSVFMEPIGCAFSRHIEHAADVYGQEAIHGIVADPQTTAKDAFDLLGETSLDDPNPSPLVEFWSYDHPATGRRAAFAKAYDPWVEGYMPRYLGRTDSRQ
ncbi:MAG TPA: M48 family metallopeptidase [Acidobacteriaceae bacterium]|jgi:Zn-dependent protease with chaperone function|nr:M48 family metallopeptidase [Acidobacteriaceae bacterium]